LEQKPSSEMLSLYSVFGPTAGPIMRLVGGFGASDPDRGRGECRTRPLRERWLFGEAAEAWVFEKAITFLHEPLWAGLIGDARERGSSVTPERRRRLLDVLDRT